MATSGAFIRVLAEAGINPRTAKDMLAHLRAPAMAPFGEKGRGQHTGHYQSGHCANVLLATYADAPSEAVNTVTIAGAMAYALTRPEEAKSPFPVRPGLTLREVVVEVLREAARYERRRQKGETPNAALMVPAWITVQTSIGRSAVVRWMHGAEDLFIPAGPYSSSSVISRTTTIAAPLIFEFGKLLADTWKRHGEDADADPLSVSSEHTNGATLPGAAPRSGNQSRNGPGLVRPTDNKVAYLSGQQPYVGSGPVPQFLGASSNEFRSSRRHLRSE